MATIVNGTLLISALNGTLINPDDCQIGICSLAYAHVNYVPTMAGNTAYLAVFAVFLVAQIGLVWKYRTWGFFVGMLLGLLLEIIGYVGRIGMHDNPFDFDQFVIYLVCLTIAPAFISASIYMCLGRLVMVYGEKIARFSPKLYTLTFMGCDLISLILQAAGGAIAATQDKTDPSRDGVDIMIAGLLFQVVSLTLFVALAVDFIISARKARESEMNFAFFDLRKRFMFRLFPYALALATLTIYIRCTFRVAELWDGFDSDLANDQVMFMIFEGPMIMVAVLVLTICHPGVAFGNVTLWQASNWTWKKKNDNKIEETSKNETNHISMMSQETSSDSARESEEEFRKTTV